MKLLKRNRREKLSDKHPHSRSKMLRRVLCVSLLLALGASLLTGCGKDTEQEQAYRTEGIASFRAGDYDTAIEKFDLALDQAQGDFTALETDIYYYKAQALLEKDDPDAAIAVYDTMLDLDQTVSSTWYLRGKALLAAGRIEQADVDFTRALQNAPEDARLAFSIYDCLKDAGQEEKGQTYLRQAIDMEGDSADDLSRKGYYSWLLGDHDQADAYLTKAVDKGSDQALLYRGMILAGDQKDQQALALFDQYLKEHATDAAALLDLAAAAFDAGMYEESIRYYQAAGDLDDADRQTVQKGLIAAYENLGDYEKAQSLMETYLASWPEDSAAQREMTYIKTRL